MKFKLQEQTFGFKDLDDSEIDELYKNFKDTYEGSTGASFDFDDFSWRAEKWTFYGEIYGGIAVRKQNSGLVKLNASYGEVDPNDPSKLSKKGMLGVMSGIKEMMSENQGRGIWGAMPKDMVRTLEIFTKRNNPDDCFKAVPGPLVIAFGTKLLSSVSSATNITVIKNPLSKNFGCLEMDTPSGRMIKQIVANKSYYAWLKEQASDKSNAVVQELVNKLGGIGKLINHLPFFGKTSDAISESNEQQIFDKILSENLKN